MGRSGLVTNMPPRQITTSQCTVGFPIILYRGVSYVQTFTYYNPDRTPIDLTGKGIIIEFKDVFGTTLRLSSEDSPTALGSYVEITDAVNGEFKLVVTDEETLTAELGPGRWWMGRIEGSEVILIWRDSVDVQDV